ncbi:L,D-transpeptidase family protein [Solitalea sp. MAHUQ-68]|uniref:L,D-transpeptidase family protein n=1 Tax=Solitalea agri TaxID=2953739 RepID=A0A9X2F5I4_9SPHI|nr:L,D-transpeptidase family protein [Solitalea agri]MCO4294500.1 L,D-transpeptidase family protein [Solitalea agri]
MKKTYFIISLVIIAFNSSCVDASKKVKNNNIPKDSIMNVVVWNKSIPGNYSQQTVIRFDSSEIDKFINKYPNLAIYTEDIHKFYRNRKFAYAWFDKNGLIEQANNLNSRIQHLDDEGLAGKVPYSEKLDTLFQVLNGSKKDLTTELMLTGSYFAFSKIAWGGTVNDQDIKSMDWFLPRKKLDYQKYLEEIIAQPNTKLLSKDPVFRQYDLLKSEVKRYRDLAEKDNWSVIKLTTKAIKPGDSSENIVKIRERLFLLGDIKSNNENALYDDELGLAVKRFQVRHGLNDDGVIGNGFMSALNISPKERLNQLLVNIERSRWVPEKITGSHIIVNIPAFKLYVFHSDTLQWDCNVVVGKALNQTVIFNGDLKYIVFSPYWNVPPSIVRKEILPGIKGSSNYLKTHKMEITGYQGNLPVVRQLPGPSNSLGLVKFLFPNSFNIYLHDTPSKSLFNEDQRAFSHGCVRVGEPKHLAIYLLRNDSTWNEAKITAAMNSGKEQYVTLKQPVPVFIGYLTAFVDHNGLLNFRKDIYNRDKRLEESLFTNNKKSL